MLHVYRNVQKHQAVLERSQHIVYKKEQYTITAWLQRVRGSITRTMQSQSVVEDWPSVVTRSTATGCRRATYARAIRARWISQEIATERLRDAARTRTARSRRTSQEATPDWLRDAARVRTTRSRIADDGAAVDPGPHRK